MSVLGEFSDRVEVLGMDEAYIDLSDSPAPKTRARQLKLRISERTRLSCSIGLGPNRLIAKIASDLDKPDGLCALSRERFLGVVGERPARIIPGVGPKTEERLERAGIRHRRRARGRGRPSCSRRRSARNHGQGLAGGPAATAAPRSRSSGRASRRAASGPSPSTRPMPR